MRKVRTIDLFCGAGGSSCGASLAGAEIVAGFDMWELAAKVYKDNFPEATVYTGRRLEDFDIGEICRNLGKIDLMLASPECTSHSPAKGNRPRCEISRETAFQVVRFAEELKPRWIVIENVVNMRKWPRYNEFIRKLNDLGYHISPQVLTASNFGVPQSRRRLFLLCDRKKDPAFAHTSRAFQKNAGDIIDLNGKYRYSPLKTERRARATLERAERALTGEKHTISYRLLQHGPRRRLAAPRRALENRNDSRPIRLRQALHGRPYDEDAPAPGIAGRDGNPRLSSH